MPPKACRKISTVLLQLELEELTDGQGQSRRDLIVSETITFYNLHRCIQFCIRPEQEDSIVDNMMNYSWKRGGSKKPLTGTRQTKCLKNGFNDDGAKVGDTYTYEASDRKFRVQVVDRDTGDGRYNVPRCIQGSDGTATTDLDKINFKLLFRRFSKAGSGKSKLAQPIYSNTDATDAQLLRMHLKQMTGPLRCPHEEAARLAEQTRQKEQAQQMQRMEQIKQRVEHMQQVQQVQRMQQDEEIQELQRMQQTGHTQLQVELVEQMDMEDLGLELLSPPPLEALLREYSPSPAITSCTSWLMEGASPPPLLMLPESPWAARPGAAAAVAAVSAAPAALPGDGCEGGAAVAWLGPGTSHAPQAAAASTSAAAVTSMPLSFADLPLDAIASAAAVAAHADTATGSLYLAGSLPFTGTTAATAAAGMLAGTQLAGMQHLGSVQQPVAMCTATQQPSSYTAAAATAAAAASMGAAAMRAVVTAAAAAAVYTQVPAWSQQVLSHQVPMGVQLF